METIRGVGPNLKSFFYHVCEPTDASLVRGTVVVLHGAEGHGGRYGPFGDELVKNGYAMYSIDHVGHGLTIMDKKDDLGKWEKNDFYTAAYNAYYLVDLIKRKYPGKPVFLLGDDYGGTMAQYMIGKFENCVDGIIVASCGMPTGRDARVFLSAWLKKVCLYDGNKSKGTFRKRTAFLNSHFRPVRTKYDWLNSDPNEVDRFIADPLSGYVGTIGYYYYQYKYIMWIPRIIKFKKINKNLPVLLIGGMDDYITHRGRKIEALKRFYVSKGFTDVDVKIYEGARHDVLLDWNKNLVAEDIAEFINARFKTVDTKRKFKEPEEFKVITLNKIGVGPTVMPKSTDASFKEEEPEDDLRLSSELKNKN